MISELFFGECLLMIPSPAVLSMGQTNKSTSLKMRQPSKGYQVKIQVCDLSYV